MSILTRYAPLSALLLLVIVSSGCTVPILNIEIPGLPDIPGFGATVVQDAHDIIVINSMEVVPDTIDSGQTAQVLAYIQNKGDKTVTDVDVDLYDYCKGLYTPRLLTCGPEEIVQRSGDDSGTVAGSQGYTKCKIARILPGEIVPVIWSVCQNRADPVKVRTVCPAEGMKMSVRYHYTTSSLTTISLISLSEMQREMIERRYDTDRGYISLGQGPIKPVITVEDKQPVPVYTVSPGGPNTNANVIDSRTVLKLQLENKGSGQLDSRATDQKTGRDVIAIEGAKIKVTGIDGQNDDLKSLSPASENCYFMSSGWSSEKIRFVGDASSPYYCTIDLSDDSLRKQVTTTTTRHVQAEVEYDYLVTKSAMITIEPKIAA